MTTGTLVAEIFTHYPLIAHRTNQTRCTSSVGCAFDVNEFSAKLTEIICTFSHARRAKINGLINFEKGGSGARSSSGTCLSFCAVSASIVCHAFFVRSQMTSGAHISGTCAVARDAKVLRFRGARTSHLLSECLTSNTFSAHAIIHTFFMRALSASRTIQFSSCTTRTHRTVRVQLSCETIAAVPAVGSTTQMELRSTPMAPSSAANRQRIVANRTTLFRGRFRTCSLSRCIGSVIAIGAGSAAAATTTAAAFIACCAHET